MRTIEVVLGGQTFTVRELPVRKNAGWRKQLAEPFAELVQRLAAAPEAKIDDAKSLADLVQSLSGVLIGSIDTLVDLLLAYSPELTHVREFVEENAYDSEIMEAFTGVLGLAFPFGTWKDKLGQLMAQVGNGSPAKLM
jgi:hypothetical protein